MYEEQKKQNKLASVISDLTSIKKQLHQLMAPNSDERTTDSLLKSQTYQLKQAPNHKLQAQRSDRFNLQQLQQKAAKESPSKQPERHILSFLQKNPCRNQSPMKNAKQLLPHSSKKSLQRKKQSQPLNKFVEEKKQSERFKFLSKQPKQKLVKNAFFDLVTRAGKDEDEVAKKQKNFSHFRHSSQRDLNLSNNLNIQLVSTTNIAKQFINEQKIQQKQFFLLNKNIDLSSPHPYQQSKKLRRMKSDLIDHSESFKNQPSQIISADDKIGSYDSLARRIKELETENEQKGNIINILSTQLKDIQAAFNQMKLSIAKIIKLGSGSNKNITSIDINEALRDIFKDLELQKEEIKRLTIDGETWRKLNFQQSLKIKSYEENLSKYREINETIVSLKEQNIKAQDQLFNLASKLEVSNNENRIKDEFIVKFLISRSMSTKEDKIDSIVHILESYLKMCSYPNNKLLEKLNEEQNEIKRLKAIIEKDRKNSI